MITTLLDAPQLKSLTITAGYNEKFSEGEAWCPVCGAKRLSALCPKGIQEAVSVAKRQIVTHLKLIHKVSWPLVVAQSNGPGVNGRPQTAAPRAAAPDSTTLDHSTAAAPSTPDC